MTDVFSPSKRSEVMSRIRGKGNKATELDLIRLLRLNGITGWRRHPDLLGKPDFVFQGQRLLIFVDGCFWHGCRWHCRPPTSNVEFWEKKLGGNRRRDLRTTALLRRKGWKVIRIWEHSLADPEKTLARIRKALREADESKLRIFRNFRLDVV